MTSENLTVGVASFAHPHAASYLANLVRSPAVRVVATDPDGTSGDSATDRGAALATRFGVEYLDDYEALFAQGLDALVVTSENSRHRELVEYAATAGVHVLCEKPMATEVADAEAMIAACDAAGVILMIAYPVRFSPAHRRLLRLACEGSLGRLLAARGTNNGQIPIGARPWFVDPELAGGGAIVDHVVHCADLLDELSGGALALSVYAASNRILHAEKDVPVETGGIVTVTYPSGLIATIDCSWSQPDNAPTWGGLSLELTGTGGTATIAPFADHLTGTNHAGALHIPTGVDLDKLMLDRFLTAVRASGPARPGTPPASLPQPDGRSGLRSLLVMDAARRSALSGQPVRISAPPASR
ncbi:MAG: Gfo/Idh/MocA family oxidoreductase [Propionicimonas sp.]